jgi:hypothetical protein
MTEEGTLSIMMSENAYKVRYASNNPHSMDRRPYKCTDEAKLGAFLQHLEIDAWYIQQAFAELWKGGFVALPIRLSRACRRTLLRAQGAPTLLFSS